MDTLKKIIDEAVDQEMLKFYLLAEHGDKLGIYPDGSFVCAKDVGKEIDPCERPIAIADCPGIGNLDMSYFHSDEDTEDTTDEEKIVDACENGDMSDDVEALKEKLIESFFELRKD